ncbi:MAG TPA: A/G-specific adenine glycosylase [Candidatus Polarisedimenticolaceae bacterium]
MTIRNRRAPLLRWYRRHRRDLPWRRTRDPYAIWVSEVMLQQTQVATVLPFYVRFLERFPDVAALAAATEEQVLAAWSGLGYYRRARLLRQGARRVVSEHGGSIPDTVEGLLAIPGIGRYTAGAIASVAFARAAPIVDGNVKRVFARWLAEPAPAPRRLWALAAEIAPGADPGDLNQALMELGATVCTPRTPRCGACPVSRTCAGRAAGAPERFPAPAAARPIRPVAAAVALIVRRGRVLLERRRPEGPLRGAWDLPARRIPSRRDGRDVLKAALAGDHGLDARDFSKAGVARHAILDQRLTLSVYTATPSGRSPSPDLRWASLAALAAEPVSGATLKILRANGPGLPSISGSAPKARSKPAP